MCTDGGSVLPPGYVLKEYIATDGTAYIDTGWSPNSADPEGAAIVDALPPRNMSDTVLLGARTGNYRFFFQAWVSNRLNIGYNSYINGSQTYGTSIGAGYHIISTTQMKSGTQKLTVNVKETGYSNTTSASNTMSNVSIPSLYVFRNNYSTPSPVWSGTIVRSIKIYNDYDMTSLARDFVPCYKESTNEYGLYDLVTDSFFGNASGSGTLSGA